MERSYETLVRIIDILADEDATKLVLVHHNGDPDAVGSALALQCAFPKVTIAAPLGLSRPGKRLMEACEGEYLERPKFDTYDHVLVVDTSNPVQLGDHAKDLDDPIILDHHAYNEHWRDASLVYIDPTKASNCELIVELIDTAHNDGATDIGFTGSSHDIGELERLGLALLTGIWTDTAGYRFAHPETFTTTARLIQATGIGITDVLQVLDGEPEFDHGKKEANLKAAQRMTYQQVGPLTVAVSHVSAYEASAAKAMVQIGADVAFCVADNKKEIRASGRARRSAVDEHGVHLGHLMNAVGKELGFMGGGHDGAAGMNLPKADATKQGVDVPSIETTLEGLVQGLRDQLEA